MLDREFGKPHHYIKSSLCVQIVCRLVEMSLARRRSSVEGRGCVQRNSSSVSKKF